MSEANDAIEAMMDELDKKPIRIKVLNTRVDTARDLVLKLYKTTSDIVKNAYLAENTIVYGNRFRITTKNDELLGKAENLFYEGKYKESLEVAINVVALYDNNIHQKIMNLIKDK